MTSVPSPDALKRVPAAQGQRAVTRLDDRPGNASSQRGVARSDHQRAGPAVNQLASVGARRQIQAAFSRAGDGSHPAGQGCPCDGIPVRIHQNSVGSQRACLNFVLEMSAVIPAPYFREPPLKMMLPAPSAASCRISTVPPPSRTSPASPALSVAMDKVPLPVFCSLELPTREPDPVHV